VFIESPFVVLSCGSSNRRRHCCKDRPFGSLPIPTTEQAAFPFISVHLLRSLRERWAWANAARWVPPAVSEHFTGPFQCPAPAVGEPTGRWIRGWANWWFTLLGG